MLKIFVLLLIFALPPVIHAQENQITPVQDFKKAEVIKIIEEGEVEIYGNKQPFQKIEVKVDKENIIIEHGKLIKLRDEQKVKVGDNVVLYRGGFDNQVSDYQIIDKYRLSSIIALGIAFLLLVLGVGRLKGLGSIVGLGISFLVIIKFIVPQILGGNDPVLISIIGSSIIILTSIYFAHGFSLKTSVAILSTIISLILTGIFSAFALQAANLTGMASELAYGLNFNSALSTLNLKGLLLGGMIIGALGVLDDVTTTQSSTVFELKKANPKLSFKELIKRGFSVGKDHIASVVNTLALAYAGVSLPVLLILILNPSEQPIWLMLNSEEISTEIVRTIAGSMGLVLAVPITTVIAAYTATKYKT